MGCYTLVNIFPTVHTYIIFLQSGWSELVTKVSFENQRLNENARIEFAFEGRYL